MYAAAATPESSSATCSTKSKAASAPSSHEGRLDHEYVRKSTAERKEGQEQDGPGRATPPGIATSKVEPRSRLVTSGARPPRASSSRSPFTNVKSLERRCTRTTKTFRLDDLCLRLADGGRPFANGAPNLTVDIPPCSNSRASAKFPSAARISKPATLLKTVLAPASRRVCSLERMVFDQHLGNRDGEVLDDPGSSNQENQNSEPRAHPAAGSVSELTATSSQGPHQLLPPRRQQRRMDNSTSSMVGYPMQIKSTSSARLNSCRAIVLDSSFMDSRSARQNCAARNPGVAELLLKSP